MTTQNKTLYRLVSIGPDGRFKTVETYDLSEYDQNGFYSNPHTREELQGHPLLVDYCGPMYDGFAIRYESAPVSDALSQ